jgi:hypothetical protein
VSTRSSSDQRRAIRGSLIGDVGLRGTACLWQALPKKFARTEFNASVQAGPVGRRRHAGMSGISSRLDRTDAAYLGCQYSWSPLRRCE